MSNNSKAYFFTILAILFWATSATAFKIALAYVEPFQLLFFSLLFSTLVLFLVLFLKKKVYLIKKVNRKNIFHAAALGFLNPFLYYIILFKAYDLLPGQIAMSLNYGWPIALMLLSVPILKQKLSLRQIVAIFISFLGAVIIATRGSFNVLGGLSILGISLALASTIIWAVFWLFNTKDGQDPVLKLFLGFLFGLVYTALVSPVFGGIGVPEHGAWLPLIYIGLFEMGITFVLWLMALSLSSSAAKVGNMIYMTPFLSLLVLNMVLDEAIYTSTFWGLILIVAGIGLQAFEKK
jgi:drug/metabolite transporter (DMT)-like permease